MPQRLVRRWRSVGVIALVGALLLVVSSQSPVSAMTTQDAATLYGYPYGNAPDCNEQTNANCVTDQWGFQEGQCHSWVAYRLNELNAAELSSTFNDDYRQPSGQVWGGGAHWAAAAAAAGIGVDDTPVLGSVAWWSANGGHVGYVEAVNGDGTVTMSEMNVDFHNSFDFATLQRGVRWPDGFIHIADIQTVSAAPNPPVNVHATAGNHQATITWTIPGSNGSPISGFTVTASPGGAAVSVGGGTNTGTVSGLVNGTSYTFTVHATNGNGNSAESTASNAVVPGAPPDSPTNASATAGNQQATVTWTAPASNGSPIIGYKVTASPGGSSTTVGAGSTSGTVGGLQNGTSYTFTVHATNGNGNSAESAASNAVVPAGPPAAPTNVHATPASQQAAVTWTAPSNNGSPLTGYVVTATPGGATVAAAAGASSATVTALQNGTSYTFTVHATNAKGTGTESAPSNAVVPSTKPDAPANVQATPANQQAAVTWTVPASNGSPITGFVVTAHPGGATVAVGPSATGATVTGLPNGTTFTFTVHATNANGDSSESAASNAVVPAGVPDPPQNVHAVAGDHAALVTWTAPADNGSPITGYLVTASPGGNWVSTGPGATSATIKGLVDGTGYTFAVHAMNANGGGFESSASNAVMPAGVPGAPLRVRAWSGDRQAMVSWGAPAGHGSALRGYVVREYHGTKLVKSVAVGAVTHATIPGLANGVSYKFTVVAKNGIGTGAASAASQPVVAGAPAAPIGTHPVKIRTGRFKVNFAPGSNSGAKITGFRVTCTSTNGGATRGASGRRSPIVVTGLTVGKTYTCTVTATNSRGTGRPSRPSAAIAA